MPLLENLQVLCFTSGAPGPCRLQATSNARNCTPAPAASPHKKVTSTSGACWNPVVTPVMWTGFAISEHTCIIESGAEVWGLLVLPLQPAVPTFPMWNARLPRGNEAHPQATNSRLPENTALSPVSRVADFHEPSSHAPPIPEVTYLLQTQRLHCWLGWPVYVLQQAQVGVEH